MLSISEKGHELSVNRNSNGIPKEAIQIPMTIDNKRIHDQLFTNALLNDPYNAPPSADLWKDANLKETFGVRWNRSPSGSNS